MKIDLLVKKVKNTRSVDQRADPYIGPIAITLFIPIALLSSHICEHLIWADCGIREVLPEANISTLLAAPRSRNKCSKNNRLYRDFVCKFSQVSGGGDRRHGVGGGPAIIHRPRTGGSKPRKQSVWADHE